MEELISFGRWVRRRRKALDMTQADLALKVNCSLSTIGKIETEQRRPSLQLAEILAAELALSGEEKTRFIQAARGLKPFDQLPPFPEKTETNTFQKGRSSGWELPEPLNPLIGREKEMHETVTLLARPDCRLLTIVGPGGVGKTRLALQAAHVLGRSSPSAFPQGVYFVPLAPVSAAENIPKAIARAVRFELDGPDSPGEQLAAFLKSRKMLLAADNTEHLLEGVAYFAELLETAPGLKILATSRQRLDLQGEWVLDLEGLPAPPPESVEDPESFEASRLFTDRARQVRRDFNPQQKDNQAIAQICRLLEGNPLAIELAAGWVRTLSPESIAVEIAGDLDFLQASARDIPERHKSLRAVFDTSWELLEESEKRALHHLSTFKGGFTAAAAAQAGAIPLAAIERLVNKSLLRRNGADRFELHELIRGYSAERTAEDPEAEQAGLARHSRFYLSLLTSTREGLLGPDQKSVIAGLSPDLPNIRAAWQWAVKNEDPAELGKAARTLWLLYDLHQYFREGEAVFDAAAANLQAAGGQQQNSAALGQFRMCQAFFALRLEKVKEAQTLVAACLETLQKTGDSEIVVPALALSGLLARQVGDNSSAEEKLQASWQYSLSRISPHLAVLAAGLLRIHHADMGKIEWEQTPVFNESRGENKEETRIPGPLLSYFYGTEKKNKSGNQIQPSPSTSLLLDWLVRAAQP